MKPLTLNFSSEKQASARKVSLVLAAILAMILLNLLFQYHDITQKINTLETSQTFNEPTIKAPALTEAEIKEQAIANKTLRQLNIPWHSLLTTLEQVQMQHPQIKLVSLQPNPNKNTLILSAEASHFAAMMTYVESLKQQKTLQQVTLVNQAALENDSEGQASKTLAFTLQAEWSF